tara:strand:- start:126 stop:368 length:243 start_codon:yes stop_codon:yes gene_type:complete
MQSRPKDNVPAVLKLADEKQNSILAAVEPKLDANASNSQQSSLNTIEKKNINENSNQTSSKGRRNAPSTGSNAENQPMNG